MKVRVKFTKKDAMCYIGHLDVMRYFQKVIRRAEIPIAFSSGFSPHMIMSFASPLGLGVTSEGEYFDIELTELLSSKEAVARMNATSAQGIEVLSFRQIPSEKKHSGMTILAGASYLVTCPSSCFARLESEALVTGEDSNITLASFKENLIEALDSFMAQPEINILKETKRSVAMVDIKPLIYEIKVRESFDVGGQVVECEEHSSFAIEMTLAAGSKENLKPNLVMKAFCSFLEKDYEEFAYQYHRLEMYANIEDGEGLRLVSLESLGEEIGDS